MVEGTEERTGTPAAKYTHAKALHAQGYTLMPLKGKIPVVKTWTNTGPKDYPPEKLKALGGNYGVVLKAGDLVVDVDPRNFEPGDKPLTRLVEKVGPLATFTVRTGGGGLHLYFSKPADLMVCHTLKAYPGLEFKSAGRQVVGPGSIHPESGKEYMIVAGSPADVKPAPAALLELIKTTAVPFSEIEDEKGTTEYKNDAGTQGRFLSYLKGAAPLSIEGKQGDATAFKVSCYGRDLGLPPALTLELMLEHWNPRCLPPWNAEELETKVVHAYKYAKRAAGNAHPETDFEALPQSIEKPENKKAEEISWVLNKNGTVIKCFYNLMNYLKLPSGGLNNVFGYNDFTGQVEFINPAPWHKGLMPRLAAVGDNDLKLLKGFLSERHNYEAAVNTIEEAVTNVAYANRFHPVRSYLSGLKWDGVSRIDTWLRDVGGAPDTAYGRAVARKVLCAAVARILRPGCKFDHVVILEGEQGIGKSRLCRILGGEWAADFTIDPHNKDTVQGLQGRWIIELAEMSVLNTKRTESAALKAFITRQTDKTRFAFGRLNTEYPRQCIFIGTINPEADGGYLMDATGNRRFWPIELTKKVDFKALAEMRDQLFAEAVIAVKGGETLYMSTEALDKEAREVVEARYSEHPWTDRIREWMYHEVKAGRITDFVTSRDIYINALGGIDKSLGRREALVIANGMRAIGWFARVRRIDGCVTRGYTNAMAAAAAKGKPDELEGLI